MKSLKQFWEQLFSKDRRRAVRQASPELAAHYWNGGAPVEHSVRDISSTGLFLLTKERWYPGTLMVITLQKRDEAEDSPDRSIAVQAKAVRSGSDGVGLEFVVLDPQDPRRGMSMLAEGADRKMLDRFLEGFGADNGFVVIKYIFPVTGPLRSPSAAWS
jgi:hypothetical protein